MDELKTFPVVEIFGPTLQGEGALAGRLTMFVRLGGCDFSCSWCDSSHAVLAEEVRKAGKITATEIANEVEFLAKDHKNIWVTLTGGNPALHDLQGLVDLLRVKGFAIAVETQGSLYKDWLTKVDLLTISPKPPSSGSDPDALSKFFNSMQTSFMLSNRTEQHLPQVCLKVPVWDEDDLEFAKTVHQRYPAIPFYLSVVTAMGGLHGDFDGGRIDTTDDVIRRYKFVVDLALSDPAFTNVGIFPQLHVLLWGHDRGH